MSFTHPERSLIEAGLVAHRVVETLPLPVTQTAAIEYWTARNGIFARSIRPGIDALIPVSQFDAPIKGLLPLTPKLQITPLIPQDRFMQLWSSSIDAASEQKEILFHFSYDQHSWQLHVPAQTQTDTSCQAVSDDLSSEIVVDVHSHHQMTAFFSTDDNAAEVGFRIYGVIGKVLTNRPQLRLRVSLYRHCWEVPVNSVFDLPVWRIEDCSNHRFYYNAPSHPAQR